MRLAFLSDIHGNLSAFEAVLADIRQIAPDLVFHGGDLADGGSSPVEIIDRIRHLGWQGVLGNGDDMLCRPQALEDFAAQSSAPPSLWNAVREMAPFTRTRLGPQRLSWMSQLPRTIANPGFAAVHATPESCWHAPPPNASSEDLQRLYSPLAQPVVAFGHTHLPFIRELSGTPTLLINSGSVGLPFDGDPRASYLLLDGDTPSIRRVEYSVKQELKNLASSALPHAHWVARMLRASSPQQP